MRDVKITLVVSLALVVGMCAWVLTRAPPRVVRVSGPSADESLGYTTGDSAICQAAEELPASVSAIRISMVAFFGAKIRLTVYSGSRALTSGRRGPGWTGTSVTVPVAPVERATSRVTLCIALGPNSERVDFPGIITPARDAAVAWGGLRTSTPTPALAARLGQRLKGRLEIEYLAAGRSAWWSRALSVSRHMGLGHFVTGTWLALLVAALTIAVVVLAARLVLREQP
jgi:hypothetical protein